MTAADAGAAFVAERVDAAVTWEPWLTRGRQAPHGHLLIDSSKHPGADNRHCDYNGGNRRIPPRGFEGG